LFGFFVSANKIQGFFWAKFDALGFSAAEVASYGFTSIRVNHDSAVWASLHAPVATFALCVFNHNYASFFGLRQGFFWTGSHTRRVFAKSAGKSKIEQRSHAYNADS
jgi:hypothetical protein